MSSIALNFSNLKAHHRTIRGQADYPQALSLRVHRALSWLQPAENEEDLDVKFLLYWIAFNAAYAKSLTEFETASEKDLMGVFFRRLIDLDHDNLIYKAIWSEFSGPIRMLLDNKYVFGPFWRHINGEKSASDWKVWFETSRKLAQKSLASKDSVQILSSLFPRIYTLRNQIIHGGATWKSKVNRDQVRDCTAILESLVPIFIKLMMDDKTGPWDEPSYPVVES